MTHSRETGLWQREATLGFFASVATQIRSGVFIGAEARYFRRYDALNLTGHALFVGPTMFVQFSKNWTISGAWGIQVAGHAIDIPGSLDLTNYMHHQVLFRLMYNF